MTATGIEGLVVKDSAQPYQGGQRQWIKVKHRETIDVICAAVIGDITRPTALIAGLPIEGELRIVGRTTQLHATTATTLGRLLRPPHTHPPWPDQIPPSTVDRFARHPDPIDLTHIDPVVVEISTDVAWSGNSFRHSLRYVRIRPELDPDEIEPPASLTHA
ncbi:hypothetical protein [Georgenia sp. AZ-5]|uniref:hypothetical protein n=1 Tax=Georgenia sp. AZ-5 TaxID=3367526 RepID=UPI0037543011